MTAAPDLPDRHRRVAPDDPQLRGRTIAIAVVLISLVGILVGMDLQHFRRDPSQSYPLFLIVIALSALSVSVRFGYATVALSALALAWFNLDGEGFAVSDPHDAIGLISLIAAGLVIVFVIGNLRTRFKSERFVRVEAEMRRDAQAALAAEIAHRVMNDLGSLAALAAVQEMRTSTDEGRHLMKTMGERIRSIGAVHRRLSENGGAATDAKTFLAGLCDDLREAHLGIRPISIELEADSIVLPYAQAAMVGLVLNEAITNTLKYAFPDERSGTILVRLRPDVDRRFCLEVIDDGVGPQGSDPKGTGLGMRLVRSIAAQLHGRHEFLRVDGLTISRLIFTANPTAIPAPIRSHLSLRRTVVAR